MSKQMTKNENFQDFQKLIKHLFFDIVYCKNSALNVVRSTLFHSFQMARPKGKFQVSAKFGVNIFSPPGISWWSSNWFRNRIRYVSLMQKNVFVSKNSWNLLFKMSFSSFHEQKKWQNNENFQNSQKSIKQWLFDVLV